MAASASDKLQKSYSFLQKSLGATITDSATSLTLNNYTNIPTDTKVQFIIDRIDSNGNRTNSTREIVSGVCNGSGVTNLSRGLHGTTAQSHDAGAVVEFTMTGSMWNDMVDWGLVEHNQDGTHSDITATTLSVSSHIDVNDGSTDIRDSSNNELVSFSKTTSAVNELTIGNAATTGAPYVQATGDDSNIDVNLIPKGTGEVTKSGNPIDWWEEIGRTTLGSAGDTITVSSLPARKYLRLIVRLKATGGTIAFGLTFNNDTGSNYSYRRSANGAADATSTSQAFIAAGNSTVTTPTFGVFDIINVSSEEKTLSGVNTQQGTAGAGNVVDRVDVYGKWSNTSDQISRIDYTNTGTGDYASGSEVIVLGHD